MDQKLYGPLGILLSVPGLREKITVGSHLKTNMNYIFGMPGALTALLATLNYWFR
jgi:hypothetical protein